MHNQNLLISVESMLDIHPLANFNILFSNLKDYHLGDRKLLFEPVERLIEKSGKCQPFSIFYPRLIFSGKESSFGNRGNGRR
jgi:hypothetical protein